MNTDIVASRSRFLSRLVRMTENEAEHLLSIESADELKELLRLADQKGLRLIIRLIRKQFYPK